MDGLFVTDGPFVFRSGLDGGRMMKLATRALDAAEAGVSETAPTQSLMHSVTGKDSDLD
jgi:hypothetical protein